LLVVVIAVDAVDMENQRGHRASRVIYSFFCFNARGF
jgi:hypothetical protein